LRPIEGEARRELRGAARERPGATLPTEHPRSIFRRFAQATSDAVGRPATFAIAVGVVLGWAATGPAFHFSDTWQLVINTGTTIVTFLMVFLIQHTQNRETNAVRLKLDELIVAIDQARNEMLAVDDLDDVDMEALRVEFHRLAQKRRASPAPQASNEMREAPEVRPGREG
jgi:low affinity Fe/Cu permease